MARTPVERAEYLMFGTGARRTPVTMSAEPNRVYSYGMCIAKKDGDDFLVTSQNYSRTTTRHIRAVHSALSKHGYCAVGIEAGPVFHYYYSRCNESIGWTRYQKGN